MGYIISIKTLTLLIISLCSAQVFGQSVQLKLKTSKGLEVLNWPTSSEFKWEQNKKGAFVFYHLVSVKVPTEFAIKKTKSKNKNSIKISEEGRSIKIKLFSNKDKISFLTNNGKKNILLLNFDNKKSISGYTNDCEKENLFLTSGLDKPLPFPVAMKCFVKDKIPSFIIVVPKDVEWLSTTISEKSGKGEVWKEYEIADIPAGDNELRGQFVFGYLNKQYTVDLKSKKKDSNKADEAIIKSKTVFSAGLGILNLSVESNISEATAGPLSAYLRMESPLSIWNLESGLTLLIPLNLSDEAGPTFFEARGQIVKKFPISAQFVPNFGLLGVFSETSDPSVYLQIKHQQLGFTGGLKYFFSPTTQLQADIWMSGFLAANPTSQMGLSARLLYQYSKALGLGLELGTQNLSTESAAGNESSFAESHVHFLIQFVPF